MKYAIIAAAVFALALASCDRESTMERAMGLEEGGRHERDQREMEASRLLGAARDFDTANPYEDKEVVAGKYREVADKYPGTQAAKEAAEMAEEVMKRRD